MPDELFESFRTKALDRLGKALASGDYFGWLLSKQGEPQKIIAGAGVIIREVPPFPIRRKNGEITIAEGRQGLIVNVFTEPEWRRRGLAMLLMEQIIAWSREQQLDGLVLHASDDGRALYEQARLRPHHRNEPRRWRCLSRSETAIATNRRSYYCCARRLGHTSSPLWARHPATSQRFVRMSRWFASPFDFRRGGGCVDLQRSRKS